MAKTFTLTSGSYEGRYLQLTCSQTTDINTNTSTISWTLSSIGGSNNYYSTGPTTVVINGTQVYYSSRKSWDSYAFPAAKGSTSGTLKVAHNTNGDKSIAVSFSTAIFVNAVSTYSGAWTLDTIPRGAKITGAASFNDTQDPVFEYSNPLGETVSELMACISLTGETDDIKYRSVSKTGTKYTFTLTDEEKTLLLKSVVGSTSRQIIYYLRTKIGSTYFYDTSYKTFTVVDCDPTISPTYNDANATTRALTGNSQTFIKGYSHLQYNLNATAKKEATFVSYWAQCGTKKSSAASDTFYNIDTNTITFAARDSRNIRVGQNDIQLNMINYTPVSCSQKIAMRLAEETEATITLTITGNFFNGSFGAVNNYLDIDIRYTDDDGVMSDWQRISDFVDISYSGNTYTLTTTFGGFSYDKTYTFQSRAIDKLSNDTTTEYTANINPIFDWSKTDFNFNVPVSIKHIEQDYLVEQGEKDGWTYRKWNSGLGECWKILEHSTAISKAWGTMYVGNTLTSRQSYPFTFTSKPVETVSLLNGSSAAWLFAESGGNGVNGAYASAVYNVCRPTSISTSTTFYFNMYVRGNWK